MELLPHEQMVTTLGDGLVSLTTHRLRYDDGRKIVSLTLDSVASCGMIVRSKPYLLLLAAFAAFGWFDLAQKAPGVLGPQLILLVVAAGLVLAFVGTRSSALAIKSLGDDILLPATGASRGPMLTFIDQVEKAKIDYLRAHGPQTQDRG